MIFCWYDGCWWIRFCLGFWKLAGNVQTLDSTFGGWVLLVQKCRNPTFRDCWLKSWSFIFKFYIDYCCDNNQYLCDHSVWFEPFHVENVFSLRCVCVCVSFYFMLQSPPKALNSSASWDLSKRKKQQKRYPIFDKCVLYPHFLFQNYIPQLGRLSYLHFKKQHLGSIPSTKKNQVGTAWQRYTQHCENPHMSICCTSQIIPI